MSTPPIQWYPGHIAKAEKALVEQLKRVDVVLEVRDCRIPLASRHPQIAQWIGEKAHILVMNRVDLIPVSAVDRWREYLKAQELTPYFTDAQHGKGIAAVAKVAQASGTQVNQRRQKRGMRPRAVRAVVVGFPNVGKSALINRLLKRRVVPSAPRPGVTRQLRWIRLSDQLEILDTPGVLPPLLEDQDAAYKLAICDDIGTAAYDNQLVAATFIEHLQRLQLQSIPGFCLQNPLQSRYQLEPQATGEEYLEALANKQHQGDIERTAHQILTDFRKGRLGTLPLEAPP
ncbi:Ribosome biogenesis GTPase A [Acaryochloris thomasi RCC1774]|uniref:Ribosome biogenesis GTPase A n=1 Tax=Acaryochloris thomasi RCC1774 TaxID=1764569 RepID=A0A2W1JJ81_9CYAN|nr:ribosome biogenesis GTPase YlqF [Acaryochloris thomasi]PZD73533.1 Ribosome biogenesis GTPase A [Acaryochloris thomasi RCC1774]